MPSFQHKVSWNDDGDDDFMDEDDIEIVSLLDHHDGNSHRDDDGENDYTGDRSAIDPNVGHRGDDRSANGRDTSPRVQLFGVCATIGFVLLVATILLSRSSTPSEIHTPSIHSNYDSIDEKNINDSIDKSNDETSQSIPSSSSTIPPSTTQTENSDAENSNEEESNIVNPQSPSSEKGGENDDGIDWFKLQTGNSRVDRAYRLAMDELNQNIEHDADGFPYFVTGAGGARSWTRNTAYAIELGAGLVQPDVSRRSLESCTEVTTLRDGDRELSAAFWYQDPSDNFGGWPNLSDAIVGARGAWHLYLYTGDSTFLEWAYETTLRSLLRAELEALVNLDGKYFEGGLFSGSASFMESNSGYPKKYKDNGELVGKIKALSTNILYYNGYHYAYKMGTILMENNQIVNSLKDRSKLLKNSIRDRLWMEEKGSYGYFEDEDGKLVEQIEGLGVALAMLSEDFESDHRIRMMFDSLQRTKLGIPSLWPRFEEKQDDLVSERCHNGRIWPFLSGYFAIAASQHNYSEIFADEMAHLIELSEQGNTFAEFYELDKSFDKDRGRQLWSDAGYLGMVYKGLFGMNFQKGAIEFSPNKVDGTDGVVKTNETISLQNVKYRKAILDIYVTGFGNNVTSFKLNGEVQESPKLDGWVSGRQLIEIEVAPSTS